MSDSHGSFIWYELLSADPLCAKQFYDAVVGWDIESQPSGDLDCRMIRRSDGGNAGGVMRLTDEMQHHGARPMWLGYVSVDCPASLGGAPTTSSLLIGRMQKVRVSRWAKCSAASRIIY